MKKTKRIALVGMGLVLAAGTPAQLQGIKLRDASLLYLGGVSIASLGCGLADLYQGNSSAKFFLLGGMGGLLASLGLYLPAYKAKLIEAVKNGTLADVQKLVSAGWDVNGKDKQGHDALWYAVEDGDTKKVAFLLENGATNVDAQDTSKASLLHYAAQNGDLSIVKLLVEHQAKIAQLNRYGETPLMCIIYSAINMWKSSHENKHKEVAEYLIARYDKQKIDIQDTRDGQTALHMAAWRGDAKLMAAIIAANANIDAKDYKGNTPLHMAGSFAAVQLLMNSGAKNIANDSGQLPIDLTTDHAIKGLLQGKTA